MRELTVNEHIEVAGGCPPCAGYLVVAAINAHRAYRVYQAVQATAAIAGGAVAGAGAVNVAIGVAEGASE